MINIDKQTLIKKIKKNEPITLTFKYLHEELFLFINTLVLLALSNRDQLFLSHSISTIIREIVINAQKANAKRVFFENHNINITDSDNYQTGMELFTKEVIGQFDSYRQELEKSNYYVSINIQNSENTLSVEVKNNVTIVSKELERIKSRINKAKTVQNLYGIYEDIEDYTEGAGLGLALTILFLKNMGIDPDNFAIKSQENITRAILHIPRKLRPDEITIPVKKYILTEIEGIPTFPKNIVDLMQLCDNPESSITTISHNIELDPALSSDVIKLSNSAGFVSNKRIKNINEAVMTIGLKNVKAILMTSYSRKILNERYRIFEDIWEHCNRTAFYARQIAIKNRFNKILESVFLGGLLHDLGKIILLATDMELIKKIASLVKNRKIVTSTILEEISIGLSHSSIGALISVKWNFPEYLIESIKHHHAPFNAKPEYQELVNTIYLANMMCGIENRNYEYNYIDQGILYQFNLNNEQEFISLNEELKKSYNETVFIP